MRGGADDAIIRRYKRLVQRVAHGEYSRSAYRDERQAYAQDSQALALVEKGLANATLAVALPSLKPAYEFCAGQSRRHKGVIDRFGRHPHRNVALGRSSTPAELAYLNSGEFPHLRDVGT